MPKKISYQHRDAKIAVARSMGFASVKECAIHLYSENGSLRMTGRVFSVTRPTVKYWMSVWGINIRGQGGPNCKQRLPEKQCAICGCMFKPHYGRYESQKCCSLKCAGKYRRDNCYHLNQKLDKAVAQVCGCCGQTFYKKRSSQTFCSKKCYHTFRAGHSKNIKNCVTCGKFISPDTTNNFCSSKCLITSYIKEVKNGQMSELQVVSGRDDRTSVPAMPQKISESPEGEGNLPGSLRHGQTESRHSSGRKYAEYDKGPHRRVSYHPGGRGPL